MTRRLRAGTAVILERQSLHLVGANLISLDGEDALLVADVARSLFGPGPVDTEFEDLVDDILDLFRDAGMLTDDPVLDLDHPFVASPFLPPQKQARVRQLWESSGRVLVCSPRGHARCERGGACPACAALRWLAMRNETEWALFGAVWRGEAEVVVEGAPDGSLDEADRRFFVVRHPACPWCGPVTFTPPAEDQRLGALPAAFETAVNVDVFGPLTASAEDGRVTGSWHYCDLDRYRSSGGGGGMAEGTDPEAHLRCVSELLERYSLLSLVPSVQDRRPQDLSEPAVLPPAFALHPPELDDASFPHRRFDPDQPRDWLRGHDLTTGESVLVPYEFIGHGLTDLQRQHAVTERHIFTGAASHSVLDDAILRGLYEVIERDAAAIAWYKGLPLPRITDTAGEMAPALRARLSHLHHQGMEVRLFDADIDIGVPTIFALATRTQTRGHFPAGGFVATVASHPTLEGAAQHVLTEMDFYHRSQALIADHHNDPALSTYDPRDPRQGWRSWWPLYMHYLQPAHTGPVQELWEETSTAPWNSLRPTGPGLGELVQRLAKMSLHPIAAEVTAPDLAFLGLRQVRVVVPGMLDGSCGRQSFRSHSPRLDNVSAGRARYPAGQLNPAAMPVV